MHSPGKWNDDAAVGRPIVAVAEDAAGAVAGAVAVAGVAAVMCAACAEVVAAAVACSLDTAVPEWTQQTETATVHSSSRIPWYYYSQTASSVTVCSEMLGRPAEEACLMRTDLHCEYQSAY
jgi:hypothetical protein